MTRTPAPKRARQKANEAVRRMAPKVASGPFRRRAIAWKSIGHQQSAQGAIRKGKKENERNQWPFVREYLTLCGSA